MIGIVRHGRKQHDRARAAIIGAHAVGRRLITPNASLFGHYPLKGAPKGLSVRLVCQSQLWVRYIGHKVRRGLRKT